MYHISNDERARKSAKKIGKGLLECLKSKGFYEITVTDVQKASNVGRATFYRLFDNITDVLSYLCDNLFEKVGSEYELMNNINYKETILKFIQAWMNNIDLLKAIVESNRMDFLYNPHTKYISNNIEFFFPKLSISEIQLDYLLMTMTSCISGCLRAWLKNGANETAENLYNRLSNSFKILYNIFSL